ncbi:DUF547 domain-containing protein [Anditalea andensis]|uniref:DUF547 domain-containing protein n=1 Tax=Anditalea andensis TaxID=1048983 RepID=A0A074L2P2_9BACT|nr:DUF547 domain-containing protein [Anditalea andensis]KEO74098.1 hypothetical protein EL17_08105 [Anditalea andensis]
MTYLLKIISITLLIGITSGCHSSTLGADGASPPSHQLWNELLSLYVTEQGKVNYKGLIKDKPKLERYLYTLSSSPPDKNTWSEQEQLAYWINAYNAFTVKLIIDHYPVKSIQDLHPTFKIPLINTVWHRKFFQIGGEDASLDEIEHKILRKEFDEPRIHFAINCASVSCPPLRNEAYEAAILERQLDEQARIFINHTRYNKLGTDRIEISPIFSWFKADFTTQSSLIDYLNKYAKNRIHPNAKVTHMKYNWDLNE